MRNIHKRWRKYGNWWGHYTVYVTDIDNKTSHEKLWASDVKYIKQARRIARSFYNQKQNPDLIVLMWQFKHRKRQKLWQFIDGRFYRINLIKRKKVRRLDAERILDS